MHVVLSVMECTAQLSAFCFSRKKKELTIMLCEAKFWLLKLDLEATRNSLREWKLCGEASPQIRPSSLTVQHNILTILSLAFWPDP